MFTLDIIRFSCQTANIDAFLLNFPPMHISPTCLSINTWLSGTKSDWRPHRPVSIIQQNAQWVFSISAEAMSSLQVRAGIYYRRERSREVCVIRDRAGACRHPAKKKEKQQISVIRVSGACLALDRGRSRSRAGVKRWNEKKTVAGAAHEAWQRLMTQRREGHRCHGNSGLSWWSHTPLHVCALAWLRRYSTLIALDKHPLALTSLCVCVYLSF